MAWEKEKPILRDSLHVGCIKCSTAFIHAPMDLVVAVGFGAAFATKDGEEVYNEQMMATGEDLLTVGDIEEKAKADPDHDWKIHMHGPMHGEIYQRHGENLWVCVESDPGFA